MDELLQKLLEAEVLTEETKQKLEEAFGTMLEEAKSAAREEATNDVRAELTEQYIKEKETLIDALDTKVGDFLEQELTELREDIERFRDLEAEKAQEIVEIKAGMAEEVKSDLANLIEQLDTFLEMRLAVEMEELREDIEEVRKNEFGRRIFEAFAEEYIYNYADENTAEATLREIQARLADTESALAESQTQLAERDRKERMANVLEPLSGRQRDVMEAILGNVNTDQLEEAYQTFIGRVVRETTEEKTSEKEDKVLAEGDLDKKDKTKIDLNEVKVVTGDTVTEQAPVEKKDEDDSLARLRKLAGIKK